MFTSIGVSRYLVDGSSQRENWRDPAAFIESNAQCTGQTIPVVGFEQDYISGNEADIFYGYYMSAPAPGNWLKFSFEKKYADLADTPLPGLINERVENDQMCPVLLWSVHHWSRTRVEAFVNDIKNQVSMPAARSIAIKEFGLDSFVVVVE